MDGHAPERSFVVLATHPSVALLYCLCGDCASLHVERVPLAGPDMQHGIDRWFEIRRDRGVLRGGPG